MSIQKNVASQKLHFLMVDATDFATPEPSMTVSAYYIKDGARSTCSNSVSEITSGLYKITLAATETNADVVTYQFTASGAADQYLVVYPEDGYANKITSILADTITLSNATYGLNALESLGSQILQDTGTTLPASISILLSSVDSAIDGPVTSILADTITLSNADYGLNALETIASDILEAIDSLVAGPLASILVDTNATLDNKIDSILEDTKEINSQCDSILADTATISNLGAGSDSAILSTLDHIVSTVDNATIGFDALETITSDILEAIDSVVAGPLASILVDTNATLDNKIDSILEDTKTTLDNKIDSILEDTKTTIPGTISEVLSTIDSAIDGPITSTITDTRTLSNATYGLNALETITSDILEAIDSVVAGPIASILVDTNTTLDNKIDSILEDTKEINSQCDSILADTITLSNATYGLDALETITSQIKSTIDAPITNFLTSIVDDTSKIHSTIDGPIESALTQNTALNSDILSTIDGAGIKPATTEPAAGAPSATAASGVKLDYLFTVFRNKIETTSGTQKVYDDAGTGVLFSCALSDDATTFTKAEHA